MTELVPRSWFFDRPTSIFRDLTDLQRDLDDLFRSVFGSARLRESDHAWWPAMESYTRDGTLFVRCDLPGVDPKDVEVSVVGNALTIRGERKASHESESQNYIVREQRYGRFERTLALPEGVDASKISARYMNGVLEVSLPLPASVAGRKVPIQIEHQEEPRKAA